MASSPAVILVQDVGPSRVGYLVTAVVHVTIIRVSQHPNARVVGIVESVAVDHRC